MNDPRLTEQFDQEVSDLIDRFHDLYISERKRLAIEAANAAQQPPKFDMDSWSLAGNLSDRVKIFMTPSAKDKAVEKFAEAFPTGTELVVESDDAKSSPDGAPNSLALGEIDKIVDTIISVGLKGWDDSPDTPAGEVGARSKFEAHVKDVQSALQAQVIFASALAACADFHKRLVYDMRRDVLATLTQGVEKLKSHTEQQEFNTTDAITTLAVASTIIGTAAAFITGPIGGISLATVGPSLYMTALSGMLGVASSALSNIDKSSAVNVCDQIRQETIATLEAIETDVDQQVNNLYEALKKLDDIAINHEVPRADSPAADRFRKENDLPPFQDYRLDFERANVASATGDSDIADDFHPSRW